LNTPYKHGYIACIAEVDSFFVFRIELSLLPFPPS
jgi:hypothetical protein